MNESVVSEDSETPGVYLYMINIFLQTRNRSRTPIERSMKENKQPGERKVQHQSMGCRGDRARQFDVNLW